MPVWFGWLAVFGWRHTGLVGTPGERRSRSPAHARGLVWWVVQRYFVNTAGSALSYGPPRMAPAPGLLRLPGLISSVDGPHDPPRAPTALFKPGGWGYPGAGAIRGGLPLGTQTWHSRRRLQAPNTIARERAPENGYPLPPGVPTKPEHVSTPTNYQEAKRCPSSCRNAPLCASVKLSMVRRMALTLSSTAIGAPSPPMSVRTQPGDRATMMVRG